ncbi:YfbU family protein [Herbaspirillum sp.]|uniref:YfbU family protein n=1 Tax=Herbaspirillum sp. TaxID=1890675 RepID=UPI00257A4DE7|nr:YfbU family protein [Herbaspirillum sp.]|tara:strand:+ start:6205 stop:6873 length:669 start_codon:yes stop_codon:yes gene_type:complete
MELRLDEALMARIDEWIEQNGRSSSRSEAVRQLVDIGLAAASGKAIHLSDGDKLNFMMLRDIVKHLKIKGETNVDLVAESIYGGHYWAPTWDMQGLFHNHADKPSDVTFVVDVLDMWTFIESRMETLAPEEQEKIKAAHHGYLPQFLGFDGNNESHLMGIAHFLVKDMKRFSRFENRDFNSHLPTAGRYRRMVDAFEPIRKNLGFGRVISVEQIIAILSVDR